MSRPLTRLLACCALLAGVAAFAAPDTQPALPEPVKALVHRRHPKAQILDFEEQIEGTRHLFFVTLKNARGEFTLLASGRGQYLGILDDDLNDDDDDDNTYVELDTAPEPVKAAIQKHVAKATVDALILEVDDNRFFYIAEYDVADKTHHATFTLQGDLTEEEVEVAPADLPAPVKAAITKARPAATLDSAGLITAEGKTSYAVEVVDAGKRFELSLTPEGALTDTIPLEDAPATAPASTRPAK